MAATEDLHVLHVCGSPTSAFFDALSLVYAREVVRPLRTRAHFAHVSPEGTWSLGPDLDALRPVGGAADALAALADDKPDVVVPHLFCPNGMTAYRALFETVLGIPVVGSSADVNTVATDKHLTRLLAVSVGVPVAPAQCVRTADECVMTPPVVVKPVSEDNSVGVALVESPEALVSAIRGALAHDQRVLVEQFIPGREIRVAVVEQHGELVVPPMIEYGVSAQHPMRTTDDKLDLDDAALPQAQSRAKAVDSICPAVVAPELAAQLGDYARRLHQALGARDYSLFDFRIDARTGRPVLLEACLFWSFSRLSMISTMLEAANISVETVTEHLWRRRASDAAAPIQPGIHHENQSPTDWLSRHRSRELGAAA